MTCRWADSTSLQRSIVPRRKMFVLTSWCERTAHPRNFPEIAARQWLTPKRRTTPTHPMGQRRDRLKYRERSFFSEGMGPAGICVSMTTTFFTRNNDKERYDIYRATNNELGIQEEKDVPREDVRCEVHPNCVVASQSCNNLLLHMTYMEFFQGRSYAFFRE